MPELPDLTVFAENLHRRLAGKKVTALDCPAAPRLKLDTEELRRRLAGGVVEKVERWGKEIDIRFGGATLRIHLMLSGRFVLTEKPERLGNRVLILEFAEGPALVVTDPKGLARVALNPKMGAAAPDALEVSANYLREKAAAKPKTLAKAFLIDQGVLRGIGNAYADEILWAARISPKAAVGRIPREAIDRLTAAIRKVLTEATQKIRDAAPEIIGGEMRDFLLIHNPRRAQSPTGYPIIKEKIASKTTCYTDEQVLY